MFETLPVDQQERWQRGERVLIADYLARYPTLADDLPTLAQLICGEIALRVAAGESPAIHEYLDRFPSCRIEIERQFSDGGVKAAAPVTPGLDSPEALPAKESYETVQGAAPGAILAEHEANLLGTPKIPGFEILDELGRGGMGIVYRARQLSADRVVALKVVRGDLLNTLPFDTRASTLERFRHEARAAARLQHDHLVSVYEVGEVPAPRSGAHGLWYYAMRYVEGCSLFDLMRDGPLDSRRAAGYIEPVARALHYAHEQGIVHRDLKPQNILIDRRLDRPLVADFGLAKIVASDLELTYGGEVMGTPAYMSPEQAQNAAQVTGLADQYSIGATLYFLLTARPPFQAASLGETLRQIVEQDVVEPRRLNPSIDRDLETICLKCLEKAPDRRYQSCGELADDLARYRSGRPIVARPVGPAERLWRWCRRNPILAATAGTAIALVFATFVSIVIGYRNTMAALAVSESRLQRALQVVEDLATRVSEDELLNEPGMQPLRIDLLEKALKHYQYFLAESGGRDSIRHEVAAAHHRVGIILSVTGSLDEALKELTSARKLNEELAAQHPQDAQRLKALADTYTALGDLNNSRREFKESIDVCMRAAQIRSQLCILDPTNLEFHRLQANALMNLGLSKTYSGSLAAGLEDIDQAQKERDKLLSTHPDAAKIRRDLAKGWYNLGKIAMEQQQFPGAVEHLRAAVSEFERLLERDKRSLNDRFNLAASYRLLGGALEEIQEDAQALNAYESGTKLIEALAAGNPDVAAYEFELAMLAWNRGNICAVLDRSEDALRALGEARELTLRQLARLPDDAVNQLNIAGITGRLGEYQTDLGNAGLARQYLTESLDYLTRLSTKDPHNEYVRQMLRATQQNLDSLPTEK